MQPRFQWEIDETWITYLKSARNDLEELQPKTHHASINRSIINNTIERLDCIIYGYKAYLQLGNLNHDTLLHDHPECFGKLEKDVIAIAEKIDDAVAIIRRHRENHKA